MDRRQQRTRKRLREALIALLHEQEFDSIRMIEIAEHADIALPTFYRHYANKLALLDDLIMYLAEQAKAQRADLRLDLESLLDLNQPSPILPIVYLFDANRVFLRRLLTTPHSHRIIQLMLQHVTTTIHTDTPAWQPHEVDLMAGFIFGYVYRWLMEDLPYTPEAVAKMAHWASVCSIMALRGEMERVQMPDAEQIALTPFGAL